MRAQKSIRRHWMLWGEHILNSKSFFVKLPQDRSYYKTSGKSKHQKWASSPCILFSFLEGTPSLLYKIKSNLGPMAMSDKRKMATNVFFFFSQRKKNKILLLDISAVFFISFKGPYEKKMLKFWESKNRSLWISNFWVHKVTIFISPQLSRQLNSCFWAKPRTVLSLVIFDLLN